MLAHRPRHALVSNDAKDSIDSNSTSSYSSSLLELYSNSDSSQDKELYYSYDETSNEYSDSKDKSPPASPTLASTKSSSKTTTPLTKKEHPIAARAQAVTLKELNYPVHQIVKMTSISRP
jgi:hypothetical protein